MFGPRDPVVAEPIKASSCSATKVSGKPILTIGLGNHDCVRYELTWAQIANLILDMLPWVVRR